MQACRRRGDCPRFAGIDGLITHSIVDVTWPPDVGRQWKNSSRVNVDIVAQFNDSLSARRDLCHNCRCFIYRGARANLHLSTRFDEASPSPRGKPLQKKKFYLTIIREFSGEDDTRIVQNEQITGL